VPYLIDSDWLIDYLELVPAAEALLESLFGAGVSISIISYVEVYEGIAGDPNPDRETKFRGLLAATPLLNISEAIAQRCASLRAMLRAQGKNVNRRAMDLLIAATALEYDLTLVTRNLEDYRDIPGLALYTGVESV
jgi:tRNA(fMet)-specific endonuclease VapC